VIGAGDSLGAGPHELLQWAALTLSLVVGGWRRFNTWLGSDAPRTADPTTQTAHVTYRVGVFTAVLLPLVTSWLVDVFQEVRGRQPVPRQPPGPAGSSFRP
jgi:hypothetical protein